MARQDRRSEARYPAVEAGARVGWWEGKHFRTAPARIEDISTGGAAVAVGAEGLTAPAVWLSLAGTTADEWVQARLAGVATADDGSQVVRLAFPASCPYELLKTVAWGGTSSHSSGSAAPPAAPPPVPASRPARSAPAVPPGDVPGCVVVVSMPWGDLPTLCQAERSVRASKDRVRALPWVAAFLIGLAVAVLLGAFVRETLGKLRVVEPLLIAPRL